MTVKGGPSNGAIVDYRVRAPQLAGRGVYASIGNCGVEGSATFSATFVTSADIFTCSGRLANTIGAQSAIQVDGANSFASAGAASLFTAPVPSANLPGLTPIALAVSTDPATGNTTIRESEIIVKCAPDATTWPVNPATCTSFAASGVRLDRTITQGRDGRLASVIDTWASTDGQPAQAERRPTRTARPAAPAFQFPWLTQGVDAVRHEQPRAAIADVAVQLPREVRLGGRQRHEARAGGAIVQLAPEAMAFRSNSSLWVKEVRTVPATGSLTIGNAYVWGTIDRRGRRVRRRRADDADAALRRAAHARA